MAAGKTGEFIKWGDNGTAIKLGWSEEYNASDNTSRVTITSCQFYSGTYYGTWYGDGSIRINGSMVVDITSSASGNPFTHQFGSQGDWRNIQGVSGPIPPWSSGWIPHNPDGTLSVPIQIHLALWRGGSDYKKDTINQTESVTLTTIPRASTISASSGNIGSNISVNIGKASPAFTHTIEYQFGNATGTIATKTGNAVLSWTPPMSLCSEIPSDVSGTCVITCKTYSGDTLLGTTSTTCTLSVPSNIKPSVSDGWATVGHYNTGTPAAGIAAFVQGYSKAEVTFNSSHIDMSGCYGATIASYRIALDNYVTIEAPYRTLTIGTSGQLSILCVVIDSRGRYTTEEIPFTVYPYSQPTLSNIDIFRCLSDGTASTAGTYISCDALASFSSINGLNSVALTARYKLVSAPDYGSGITLQNNQPNVIGDGQISTTSTYLLQLIATDALGNTSVIETRIATEAVAFNIRAGGQGVAFGKFCESDKCLELPADWSIKIGGVDIFDIIAAEFGN